MGSVRGERAKVSESGISLVLIGAAVAFQVSNIALPVP